MLNLDWRSLNHLPNMRGRIAEASDDYETYYAEVPDGVSESDVMDDFVSTYQFANDDEDGFNRAEAEAHLRQNVASVRIASAEELLDS